MHSGGERSNLNEPFYGKHDFSEAIDGAFDIITDWPFPSFCVSYTTYTHTHTHGQFCYFYFQE